MKTLMWVVGVMALGMTLNASEVQLVGATGSEYRSGDGSMSMRLPVGWRGSETAAGGVPIQILQPADGAEDRILVGTGPLTVSTIQELAALSAQVVTEQLLPGTRLIAQPKYLQTSAGPAVELRYELVTNGSSWFHLVVMMKDQRYLAVLGGAPAARAAAIEQQSRAILESVRFSAPLAAAGMPGRSAGASSPQLVGHWTWYHRTAPGSTTTGSTSKELWIYPNGRYQYTATTYVPDMPPGIDPTTTITGSYQLQGNRLTARADNGQSAMFTVEIVEGGKGLRIDGELWIRE